MFRVKVTVKQLGKKRERFSKQNFCLRKKPETVKDLIEQTVLTCVDQYNARLSQTDVSVLPSQGEMEAMAELGKVAFGAFAEGKAADPRKAVDTAIVGYQDGLYRIFLNDRLLTGLDEELSLQEDDHLIFIRLVMLAGSMW